jgi:hypothetical protein
MSEKIIDVIKDVYDRPDQIEVPVWYDRGGGLIVRRDALSPDNPEHTYNYMKNVMNVCPEDYGVLHPDTEKYKDYTKEQLMSRIIELEKENRYLSNNIYP